MFLTPSFQLGTEQPLLSALEVSPALLLAGQLLAAVLGVWTPSALRNRVFKSAECLWPFLLNFVVQQCLPDFRSLSAGRRCLREGSCYINTDAASHHPGAAALVSQPDLWSPPTATPPPLPNKVDILWSHEHCRQGPHSALMQLQMMASIFCEPHVG